MRISQSTTILSLTLILVAGIAMVLGRSYGATSALAESRNDSGLPATCPVTRAPSPPFVPPSPYPVTPGPGSFWFGTQKLWTNVSEDGTWKGLPHYRPRDASFRNKLFWWRQGYDWRTENVPNLKVTGRRLDTLAPPLTTDEHANSGWTNDSHHPFIVAGIFIPTLGCWEITGDYKGDKLSYVVWVAQ